MAEYASLKYLGLDDAEEKYIIYDRQVSFL